MGCLLVAPVAALDLSVFSSGGASRADGTIMVIGLPTAGVDAAGGGTVRAGVVFAWVAQFPSCPGDLDGDGDTDLADLGILLADFGCTPPASCPGDLDNDGDTDLADLGILLADFGCAP
jgi:hypothetical protein